MTTLHYVHNHQARPGFEEIEVFFDAPLGTAQKVALYASVALVTSLVGFIVLYSAFTHGYMNKMVADPAMAALTSERFFLILKVSLPIIGVSIATIIAIKIHQFCKEPEKAYQYVPKPIETQN